MATRTTKKAISGVTDADAQSAAAAYAKHTLSMDTLTAKMNEELEKIRQKYQPQISDAEENLEEPVEVLSIYAVEQRAKWDGKSIELGGCTIGFRTNPPSVQKPSKVTWAYILNLMNQSKVLKAFVKVKEDIDKAAILKETDAKVLKALEKIEVTIAQEELFFVDVKKEKVA
jgi:phage host-nuclease inhibitor protein Gam